MNHAALALRLTIATPPRYNVPDTGQREGTMPVYEYLCKECHKHFEKILTLDEHERGKIICPRCGSKKVEQEPAAFFAVTSRKS